MSRQRREPKLKRDRKSPYWCYDFQIGGHRYAASTERTNKGEAQAILKIVWRAAIADVERQQRTGREPMTIAQAAARWWDEVGAHGKEQDFGPYPSSDPAHAGRPLAWLVEQLGPQTRLDAIRDSDVAGLVALRRKAMVREADGGDGKPAFRVIKPSTVNRTVPALLRRLMARAVEDWNVDVHHMPKWSRHMLRVNRKQPRVISFAEQAKLDGVERPELKAVRAFALLTGLRLAEVVTLTWPQVDFLAEKIRVIQKGGEPRVVTMTAEVASLLRSLRGHHPTAVFTYEAKRTFARHPNTGQVIVRGERYPLTREGLRTAHKRDWGKAGIKATFHDLRRTFADELRASEVGIETISVLMGHGNGKGDVRTTARYLGEVPEATMRAAMRKREAYVAAKRQLLSGSDVVVDGLSGDGCARDVVVALGMKLPKKVTE